MTRSRAVQASRRPNGRDLVLILAALAMTVASPALAGTSCYEMKYGIDLGDTSTWKSLADPACKVTSGGSNGKEGRTVIGGGNCANAYVGAADLAALNALNGGLGLDTLRVGPGGTLIFKDENFAAADPDGLRVSSIIVEGTVTGSNPESDTRTVVPGTLIIGTKACPIGKASPANTVTLTFWADSGANPVSSTDPDAFAPCDAASMTGGHCDPTYGVKVLAVGRGGVLSLYGSRGIAGAGTSWTHLSAGAPAQAATLSLQDPVDWRPGDWIVVATTDYSSHHSELVQIASLANPNTLTLNTTSPYTPLKHDHFGGAMGTDTDPFPDNFGVDERAEVGLLTRSIRLTAQLDDGINQGKTPPSVGAHLIVRRYFGGVAIQGVEFEKVGQGGTIGTYPIHFHLTVDTPTLRTVPAPPGFTTNPWAEPTVARVDSNSIHHSFTRCVTIHATNGLTVSNNVCARNIGHAYFLEDGVEQHNVLHGNLAVSAMAAAFTPTPAPPFFDGDQMANPQGSGMRRGFYSGTGIPNILDGDKAMPTAFWITHPNNWVTMNSAAGCHSGGRGFWYIPVAAGSGLSSQWFGNSALYGAGSAAHGPNPVPYGSVQGAITPLPVDGFALNRAHACYTGLDSSTENAPGIEPAPAPGWRSLKLSNFLPVAPPSAGSGAGRSTLSYWEGFTATRNRNRGVWLRPNFNHLTRSVIATNIRGATVVSSGSADGSPPGIWSAITDSLFVGRTSNRAEEFGPPACITNGNNNTLCNEVQGGFNGYPRNQLGQFGLMFYDGPGRLENNTFVNFKLDPGFDQTITDFIIRDGNQRYPGDAAIGWFGPPNQQSYAGTQYMLNTTFKNVDLRHLVFTERTGNYEGAYLQDGDQNTVIRDRDGTLAGFSVLTGGQTPPADRKPFILNNLPFHSTPSTLPECYSAANLDTVGEAYLGQEVTPFASSLVSPHRVATLAINLLNQKSNSQGRSPYAPVPERTYPPDLTYRTCGPPFQATCANHVTLLKDQEIHYETITAPELREEASLTPPTMRGNATWSDGFDFFDPYTPSPPYNPEDPTSQPIAPVSPRFGLYLTGRTNRSTLDLNRPTNFEPKVTSGLSYTLHFPTFGTPQALSLALMDADATATDPFRTRVGICYKNYAPQGATQQTPFIVKKRQYYFSGGDGFQPGVGTPPYEALPWRSCPGDLSNCPTAGQALAALTCNSQTSGADCLTKLSTLDDQHYLFDLGGKLLFVNLTQAVPNGLLPATGQLAFSPAGTCRETDGAVIDGSGEDNRALCQGDQGTTGGNMFWVCPKEGCSYYTIEVADPSYTPDLNGKNRSAICDTAYPTYYADYSDSVRTETLEAVTGLNEDLPCVVNDVQQGPIEPWVGTPPRSPEPRFCLAGISSSRSPCQPGPITVDFRGSGRAQNVGIVKDTGNLRLSGRFTLPAIAGSVRLDEATLTLTRLLHEPNGVGELVRRTVNASLLPITLSPRRGSRPFSAVYQTASGARPQVTIAVKTLDARTGSMEFTVTVDRATIPVGPARCAGSPSTAPLETTFTLDDGVAAPLVVDATLPWRCLTRELRTP